MKFVTTNAETVPEHPPNATHARILPGKEAYVFAKMDFTMLVLI